MKYLQYILFLIMTFLTSHIFAINNFTINGHIKDSLTGEDIIGALIISNDGHKVVSNSYGFFSLTLSEGNYTIKISAFGFLPKTINILLNNDIKLNVLLSEVSYKTEEVIITNKKEGDNLKSAQLGVEKIEIKELNKIPVLLGEKDILKSIQLLPGIKSAGEGSSGFNVRGGTTDQNLILLDEALVYNSSHLLGFFSTFNSDAIKDIQIYKGTQPAIYGGRIASVLDIKMKEGNNQKYGANGGIGLISSRFTLEGPLKKGKSSFILSGRRTYLDQFFRFSSDTAIRRSDLYFYDLNTKINYQINDKNKVYLSFYNGRDVINLGNFGINWGNTTITTRLNHVINPKWFSNTSLIFTNFDYMINLSTFGGNVSIFSNIRDFSIKQEFTYFRSPKSNLIFGANFTYHIITPGRIKSESSTINTRKIQDRFSLENCLYFSHDYKINSKTNILFGLRLTNFAVLGPGYFYNFDNDGNATDSTYYNTGNIVKNYFNLEPRLGISYMLNESSSIKTGYTRNTQNLHQISNSTSGNPTDRWISSSNIIKPGISDQFSIGYLKNINENKYEFSIESYYKKTQNEIDFKNYGNTTVNEKIEGELKFGIGRAYGIEFLIKKKSGKLTGWIGYTLSRTEKKINDVNDNKWYLAKQDRTHDISIVTIYELSPKWSISGVWVYNTGNAVTFPSGKYIIDGNVYFLYTERNGYRMPAYHRMDIGVNWTRKKNEKFESIWTFSIYNAYARENAYTINFQVDPNNISKTQAVQTSLFKIVPAITYNFKF